MAAAMADALPDALLQQIVADTSGARGVRDVRRLSGGASQETWLLTLDTEAGPARRILRRAPGGKDQGSTAASVPLAVEAKLMRCAAAVGVPVPRVHRVLTPGDGFGAGFLMDFVDGETIPRKILRDDTFAAARPRLAAQCGEILARLHTIAPSDVPELRPQGVEEQLAQYRAIYDAFDDPRPVFEFAFRWLADHVPEPVPPSTVHGDFRNGNLIINADGVRAVLDWELAHVGDPCEDLGWICVASWRFGHIDRPVGGFGQREELFAAYERAGGRSVDPRRVHYWEVYGTLKWGVICMMMYGAYKAGLDRSVERAAIGRRTSETEIDLLTLLAPRS